MSDRNGVHLDSLDLQALLYTAGSLDAAERQTFEQRLSEEQPAREALSRVAGWLHLLGGHGPLQPTGRYRAAVREQFDRWRPWQWLFRPRPQSGHPVLWIGVGVAAALAWMTFVTPPPPAPLLPQSAPLAVAPVAPAAPAPEAEQAKVWADMPRNEHLLKAHDKEQQRRLRLERLSRLPGLDDQRLPGSRGNPMMKN